MSRVLTFQLCLPVVGIESNSVLFKYSKNKQTWQSFDNILITLLLERCTFVLTSKRHFNVSVRIHLYYMTRMCTYEANGLVPFSSLTVAANSEDIGLEITTHAPSNKEFT